MADISRTVEIIFGAIDRNTKSTINEIESSLATFDSGLQSVAGPVGNFTESLLKAEAAVAALAAAYGLYAVNEAAKFESSQIDLKKVLDGDANSVSAAMSNATAKALELSDKYGVASTEILQGVANFKQAGFDVAESLALQEAALDLVIAGDLEAAQASELLVASLKGFNAEASEAPRFMEAMNNVSSTYATNLGELAIGMSKVSPVLDLMGFSFEQGTGLITPLIEVFRSGSVAADALKTGLLKLIDDSAPVTSALAALGVSQTDLNGKMRSGSDIFYDVANAFQTVDENQKLVFASQLFGVEQAPKLILAFNNIAKVNAITATALEITGSVTKEVELRLASAEKQVDRFKTGFNNLAIILGGELLSNFSGIIGGATEIEIAFRKVVEAGGLAPLFDALKPQLYEFEKVLKAAAQNLPQAFEGLDFSGLVDAFEGLGVEVLDAFKRMFGDVDLTTVEGLRTAIQNTINIIESFVNITTGIIDQFDPIFEAIGVAGQQMSGASTESEIATGKLLGALTILSEFGTKLGIVLFVLKEAEADITNVFNTLVGGGRILTNGLQVAFDAVALAVIGIIEGFTAALARFLDAIGADETAAKFYATTQNLKETANAIKANLASNAGDMADAWGQMSRGITGSSDQAAGALSKVGTAAEAPKFQINELAKYTGELTEGMKASGFYIDEASGQLRNLESSAAGAWVDVDALTEKMLESGVASESAAVAADLSGQSFKTLADAEAVAAATMIDSNNVTITYKDGLYTLSDSAFGAADSAKALADETNKASLAAGEGSKEWKAVQDVMLATQKQTDDFQIAIGKLANERYEIDVQANVDLQVAQIEADTARIAAAFTAASEAISTLTQGTTDLYGLFAEKAGFLGSDELLAAAQRMEDRLDAELELKRQMTEAAVAQANATTLRLSSGEPLISIDAGTLAPELELVFDKILKFTQIRATQEGLSLLVGV